MIFALLLSLSLSAHAQEASSDTFKDEVSPAEVSNLGKKVYALQSGRPQITGKPTYRNGFCFGDNTCQTTAASSGLSATSSPTVTGSWTFNNPSSTQTVTSQSNIACVWVSSVDFGAIHPQVAYATLTIPSGSWGSTQTYMVEWSVRFTSAAPWLALMVNNETAAPAYKDSGSVLWNGGLFSYTNGTAGHGLYYLNTNSSSVGDTGYGRTWIRTNVTNTRIHLTTDATWDYTAGASGARFFSGGTFTTAGTLTQVTMIGTTAGVTTKPNGLAFLQGSMTLFRCGTRNN